jgi:Tol biopolymer transport system component
VNRGLLQIEAGGGTPRQITEPSVERVEEYHAWPSVLPDGEHVLFSAVTADSSNIAVLSLTSGDWRVVEDTEDATQAHYLDSGHLVFFRQGSLFAAPFALSKAALTGPAVLVLDGVLTKSSAGHRIGYFTVSRNGTLMYLSGGTWSAENRIVSVTRDGEVTPLVSEPGVYSYGVDLSPDGTQLVVTNIVTGNGAIWVHDLTRGTRTVLARGHSSIHPVWSSDGERVLFAAFKGPSFDLYATLADGSGEHETLLEKDHGQLPTSVSPDGRLVALWESNPASGQDIHILSLDGDRATVPFLTTPANEWEGSFSPDSRYLAYSSNVSGRYEVYVGEVSGTGGRTTISKGGGRWPHWSSDGDELFYISGSTMMAVSVTLEPAFEAGSPEPLFEGAFDQWYDVSPDGSFVMLTKPSAELTEINVILNWLGELELLVPTD